MMPPNPSSPSLGDLRRSLLFLCLAMLLPSALTQAADLTWNGGGGDNNWGTGLNWGGTAPLAGDSLSFSGSTRLTSVNNLTADTRFAGITFNSGAGAFTLSGNRITLGGDVTNNSASLQTLSLPLLLDAARSFNMAAGNLTVSGIVSGPGGLIKTGAGTLNLSGSAANTYSGLTTVNAGVLNLNKTAGLNAVAGNLEVVASGKVAFAASNQIADTSLVTISGAGSIFNGTAVNTGMPTNQVETIGGMTATGGTFNTGGNSNWTVAGAGSFTGGADNTLFLGNSGARISFNSLSIAAMPNVPAAVVGTGNSFTLYGNSTVLSTITVGNGGLTLDASRINLRRGAGTTAGSRLVLNGGVTTLGTAASFITEDAAGGTAGVVRLELSGTADPVEREFNIGAGGANLTINVEMTNGASSQAGLTKTGNGTLTFSGGYANTYTGITRINGGALVLAQNAGVTAVAGDIVVNAGGTLTMNANDQIADTAGITVNTGGTISPWSRTETIAYYTQNGGGVTASGNSGQVTILGAMKLLGGNVFTINSSSIPAHFRMGSLEVTGTNVLVGGNNGIGIGRSTITVGSGGLSMAGGRIITLYRGSAGTVLNLEGNFTGVGNNSIIADSTGAIEPELNLGSDTRTFDIATGGNTSISVGIVGMGGLTKTGAGTLTFIGNLANTYSGTTTINEGILNLNQTVGTDAITGGLDVRTGGTLTLTANEQIANSTGITVNGGTISALTTTETLAYYTQNSGGFPTAGNVGSLIVTGTATVLGGNNLTINSAGATPPAWELNAAILTGAGIIVGGNNGTGNPRTRLTIGSGGLTMSGRNVTLNGGNAGTEMYLLGDVTATGTSGILFGTAGTVEPELHLGTGTRTFQITNGTTTLSVKTMDAAAILKTGAGTLLMSTANTYSGGTTVSAGTLRITNAAGSATGTGAFALASGATLSGTGRIVPAANQNITISGILSVGLPSPVTGETLVLTASGLGTVQIDGRVVVDLFSGQGSGGQNGAAAADRLIVSGAAGATLGSGSVLNVTTSIPINASNTGGWVVGTAWQVIDWAGLTGGLTGSFGNLSGQSPSNYVNLPDLSSMGFAWDVSDLYTQGIIKVALIPEPSRMLLLILGLGALIIRRRRNLVA